MGDVEGAWNAAIAGWVRSTLSPETTGELRADLDRLVMQALIPERSRVMSVRDPQEAVIGPPRRMGPRQAAVEIATA